MEHLSKKFSTIVLASLALISASAHAIPSGENMSIWIDVGEIGRAHV